MEPNKMKVAITISTSGKLFCMPYFAKTVKQIIESKLADFTLVLYDNSNLPSVKRRFETMANNHRIPFIYFKDESNALINMTPERRFKVNDMFVKLFSLVPEDTDYVLNIEDDISCDDTEAFGKMLNVIQESQVATIVASSFARQGPRIGLPQENEINGIGVKQAISKETGVQEVATTAMGFWLTKNELIKKYGIPLEYNGFKSTDVAWAVMVRDKGYRVLVDWGINVKHWFKDEEGIVSFYDKTNNLEVKPVFKKLVQLPRYSSPLFVQLDENTDESLIIEGYKKAKDKYEYLNSLK